MNRLRAHVTVSMLGHGSLCDIVIRKLVPNRIKNQVGLFEAYELKDVHVVVEAQVEVLFLRQVEKTERLNVIRLDVVPDPGCALHFCCH